MVLVGKVAVWSFVLFAAASRRQRLKPIASSKGCDQVVARHPAVVHCAPDPRAAARTASSHEQRAAVALENRIAARLADRIGQEKFFRYFGGLGQLRLDDTGLEVAVPSTFVAELLERRYRDDLLGAVETETGTTPHTVRFVVGGTGGAAAREETHAAAPATRPDAPAAPRHQAAPRRRSNPATTPRFDLADFVTGPANRLGFDAALRLAESPADRSGSPLVLFGPCGVGKTHLLHGAVQRFLERHAPAAVRITTGELFLNDMVAAIRAQRVDAFRRDHRTIDLLAIDDLSIVANKVGTQAELVSTIDALASRGGRLCVALHDHPRRIEGLSPALLSRLMGGLVVGVEAPDLHHAAAIASALARRRGLLLDDDAAHLLAAGAAGTTAATSRAAAQAPGHCKPRPSVRDLEGAVVKLHAVQSLLDTPRVPMPLRPEPGATPPAPATHARVGILAVQRALHGGVVVSSARSPLPALSPRSATAPDSPSGTPLPRTAPHFAGPPRRPIRFDRLLAVVCEALRVPPSEVLGKGRHAPVVLARSMCALLARRLTSMSFPEIAAGLGRSNHSTVITACQRVERQARAGAPAWRAAPGQAPAPSTAELLEQLAAAVQAA